MTSFMAFSLAEANPRTLLSRGLQPRPVAPLVLRAINRDDRVGIAQRARREIRGRRSALPSGMPSVPRYFGVRLEFQRKWLFAQDFMRFTITTMPTLAICTADPAGSSVRSSMVRAAPTSAWRTTRDASTSTMTPNCISIRYRLIEAQLVKQLLLVLLAPPHHDPSPTQIAPGRRNHARRLSSTDFCNTICQKQTNAICPISFSVDFYSGSAALRRPSTKRAPGWLPALNISFIANRFR